MNLLNQLNQHILKRINDYQTLKIAGQVVSTPFYINNIGNFYKQLLQNAGAPEDLAKKVNQAYKNREVPFGWYRGKGTPEQIAQATEEIAQKIGFSLKGASAEGITEFMKLYGLGIDCSGFIYNILSYALDQVGKLPDFQSSLNWSDPEKQDVDHAGTLAFAGDASQKISSDKLQSLDLLLIKEQTGYFKKGEVPPEWRNEPTTKSSPKASTERNRVPPRGLGVGIYSHLGLLVERSGTLYLAQSSIGTTPTGVTLNKIVVKDKTPCFKFKTTVGRDWNSLFSNDRLEFRRLSCIIQLSEATQ